MLKNKINKNILKKKKEKKKTNFYFFDCVQLKFEYFELIIQLDQQVQKKKYI